MIGSGFASVSYGTVLRIMRGTETIFSILRVCVEIMDEPGNTFPVTRRTRVVKRPSRLTTI